MKRVLSLLCGTLIVVAGYASASAQADDELHIWLFPRNTEFERCTKGMRGWINDNVGRITVGCNRSDLFHGGHTQDETPLMRAGVGLHPYVAVAASGRPYLRYALTLPYIDLPSVGRLTFIADEAQSEVFVVPGTRHLYVEPAPELQFLSLDLHGDSLSREFLEAMTEAKVRMVRYGPDGSKKQKISKASIRAIGEMLALYDALLEDAGGR